MTQKEDYSDLIALACTLSATPTKETIEHFLGHATADHRHKLIFRKWQKLSERERKEYYEYRGTVYLIHTTYKPNGERSCLVSPAEPI
jgi:hypothetical protein